MIKSPTSTEPQIVVAVAAARRPRVESLLTDVSPRGWRVTLVSHDDAATRHDSDRPTARLWLLEDHVPANDAFAADYTLPGDCSAETFRAVLDLLARLAVARFRLHAAEHRQHELFQLAETDPLTGLGNRRHWDVALLRYVREAEERNEPLTAALIDLDGLKQVNDRQGHAAGDAAIRAAADGLRRAIRRGDLAVRLGGDEFGLLLPGVGKDRAPSVIERIRQAVVDTLAEAGVPTTCTIGFVVGPVHGESASHESGKPNPLYLAVSAAWRKAKNARPAEPAL
jgi:diguanylate cyclase (GGDEF)-like protein